MTRLARKLVLRSLWILFLGAAASATATATATDSPQAILEQTADQMFQSLKENRDSFREEPTRVNYVKGMENPTEGYNNMIRWLVKHGYSDEEIIKVAGGNILRVLNEVWV